jgi:hypothetical protein
MQGCIACMLNRGCYIGWLHWPAAPVQAGWTLGSVADSCWELWVLRYLPLLLHACSLKDDLHENQSQRRETYLHTSSGTSMQCMHAGMQALCS